MFSMHHTVNDLPTQWRWVDHLVLGWDEWRWMDPLVLGWDEWRWMDPLVLGWDEWRWVDHLCMYEGELLLTPPTRSKRNGGRHDVSQCCNTISTHTINHLRTLMFVVRR